MQRHLCQPRPAWREQVERTGLTYHSHETGPYWDESACYELTAVEVNAFETAAKTLHYLCIDAAEAVIKNDWWQRLGIAPAAVPAILRSWERDDFSLYGRFDLALDGCGVPKMLEYNADTPTALVEAAVTQWFWLQDTRPEADQFNSIHERLIEAWRRWAGTKLHFGSIKDHPEDEQTVLYLRDTCEQAGVTTRPVFIEDIGWDAAQKQFVDLDGVKLTHCFKLYPWEWLWHEEFGPHLAHDTVQFIEPTWKMLLSNKGLLPILWELFPEHPNLLPAYESAGPLGSRYIRKPKLSREGANVTWIEGGVAVEETGGEYGEEGHIFQAVAEPVNFDGHHPVFGVWVVDHEPAGLGIREDTRRITGNLSRFVPHFFPSLMSYANYDNPTALRLGAQGTFDGRQFTVKGRVVLGMELDGETYYWNEFNLVDQSGGELTLVHEETEDGYVWKLFRLYEPLHALSVGEARAKRAGETVNFEGRPIHISLVDQSRVCHIEGEAPEGVEVGDIANYFNADAGDRSLVASWSGDEIEFYEGRDLPEGRVERAFNLTDESTERAAPSFYPAGSGGGGFDARTFVTIGGLLLTIIAALFSCNRSNRHSQRAAPPPPPPVPVVQLVDNTHGALAGRNYTIAGQAQVEIAKQGGNFDRLEFDLADDTSGHALFINALNGGKREWHLFQPMATPEGFTPYEAAALRQNNPATIGGRDMQVTQLFQSRVLWTTGKPSPTLWSADMQYGLLARVNNEWLIARWNETEIQFFSGKPVPESEVRAAFAPVEGKAK